MAVDQSLSAGRAEIILIEEQITQTVVDERAVPKFHALRLMRLAATHNDSAGFSHLTEVLLLVRRGRIRVILMVLKCGDDQIAIRFETGDLLRWIKNLGDQSNLDLNSFGPGSLKPASDPRFTIPCRFTCRNASPAWAIARVRFRTRRRPRARVWRCQSSLSCQRRSRRMSWTPSAALWRSRPTES